jgi:8-oxo-dGTP diphosphatase
MIKVTCAIIMEKRNVLVTQRSERMAHPLKWEFPGGKLKEGETPDACIHREIKEELGIDVCAVQLLPSVKHSYGSTFIELIPFICRCVDGDIVLSEHKAYQWVHLSELGKVDWLEADVKVVKLLKQMI